MVDPVIPREKRILSRLKGYCSLLDPSDVAELNLPGEAGQILGIYDNEPGNRIFVGHHGIVTQEILGSSFIRYTDIMNTSVPGDNKLTADHILVTLKDGTQEALWIKQGNGKFRDVWEFYRFLNRVVEDLRSRSV